MAKHIHLFVGTRKGAFILSSTPPRKTRSAQSPLLKGADVSEVQFLSHHPTREKWNLDAAGSMVHSITLHLIDTRTMFVAISAAGTFATTDGGATREPRNKNVHADFMPDKFPDVGQCVHHLEMHPAQPELLYQQKHCGVYHGENEGRDWADISTGLPSRFGFPLQIHPYDPDTISIVSEEGAEFRAPVAVALPCIVPAIVGRFGRNSPTACRNAMHFSTSTAKR